MDTLESLITLCLDNQLIEGVCGPEDPWDEAVRLSRSEPERAWLLITGLVRQAATPEQFAKIAAGPLSDFWRLRGKNFLGRLRDVAPQLPQLVNLVVATERRDRRSTDLMNVITALGGHLPKGCVLPDAFEYTPYRHLAELIQPGRHPMTESLLVQNWSSFGIHRSRRRPVTEEELDKIVERYIGGPSAPVNDDEDEDSWWVDLDHLGDNSPEQAWTAMLRIIAREHDGVDVEQLGAGALEFLICDWADELLDQIEPELERNPGFVRALGMCRLFRLSEAALSRLAAKGREILAMNRAPTAQEQA